MKKLEILALISALALLPLMIFLATLNLANANSNQDNPLPFLPPLQQQTDQPPQEQPLNSNELSNGHKNQFDNHSPTVTSVIPF